MSSFLLCWLHLRSEVISQDRKGRSKCRIIAVRRCIPSLCCYERWRIVWRSAVICSISSHLTTRLICSNFPSLDCRYDQAPGAAELWVIHDKPGCWCNKAHGENHRGYLGWRNTDILFPLHVWIRGPLCLPGTWGKTAIVSEIFINIFSEYIRSQTWWSESPFKINWRWVLWSGIMYVINQLDALEINKHQSLPNYI